MPRGSCEEPALAHSGRLRHPGRAAIVCPIRRLGRPTEGQFYPGHPLRTPLSKQCSVQENANVRASMRPAESKNLVRSPVAFQRERTIVFKRIGLIDFYSIPRENT